jgi:hypothetical protein
MQEPPHFIEVMAMFLLTEPFEGWMVEIEQIRKIAFNT